MDFISPGAPQYKANLHSHSNLSDGRLTPEELIRAYREAGYSILAITDHEASYDHTAASGPDFLMVTGYEAYIRPSPDCRLDSYGPEIHLNLLAKEPHNTTLIGFDPKFCKYMPPEEATRREKAGDLGPRRYDRAYIQAFIDQARQSGYLVTYNHPCWSMESQEDILAYSGCFSLEVFNTGSMKISGAEGNVALYDRMLRMGRRLYVHGADDNHNHQPFGSPLCDSFGAWTMVMAGELSYPAVIRALEEGRFYASTGPAFTRLSFEGSAVRMEFSGADRAIMHMSPKWAVNACAQPGEPFERAEFIIPDQAPYVYFSLLSEGGRRAVTRAFTRAELGI